MILDARDKVNKMLLKTHLLCMFFKYEAKWCLNVSKAIKLP